MARPTHPSDHGGASQSVANSPTASDEEPDDSTALEGVKATKGVSLAIRDTAFALSLLLSEGTDADMTKTTIKEALISKWEGLRPGTQIGLEKMCGQVSRDPQTRANNAVKNLSIALHPLITEDRTPGLLSIASHLLTSYPQVVMECTCDACPVCGYSTGKEAKGKQGGTPKRLNARTHWSQKGKTRAFAVTVLTQLGPKHGTLNPRVCLECDCTVHIHTAVTESGDVLWLRLDPDEVGVIRIKDTLYIEVGLLKQLMFMLHRASCSYETLAQLYMGMWAREATTPCMNPDGRDLMTAVQLYAVSQILNDDVWAFHSQQPQPEGLSSQAHPLTAVPARRPTQPGALFIVSRKPRFRQPAFDTFPEGNIDDLSDRAGVDPHTYEDRSMSEGGRSQAEGGDGDEAGERTPRRHESMDRRYLDGVIRLVVTYLQSQAGQCQLTHTECDHPVCQANTPVLIVDGTQEHIRLHVCKEEGCPHPPGKRTSAVLSEVVACRKHSRLGDVGQGLGTQRPRTPQTPLDDISSDLDEGSEDEESSSEQTAAKEKQSARLAGVLGAFLPCGHLKALVPQYEEENASTFCDFATQLLRDSAVPPLFVYNDALRVIEYLSGDSAKEEHKVLKDRLAIDAFRFIPIWQGACKELQKLTQRRDEQRAMKAAEEQEDTAKGRGAFNGNRAQLSEREKRAEKEGRKKQRAQRKRERKATHRECRAARAKVKALQDLSPFMKEERISVLTPPAIQDSDTSDTSASDAENDHSPPVQWTWAEITRTLPRLLRKVPQRVCQPSALRLSVEQVQKLIRAGFRDTNSGQGSVYVQVQVTRNDKRPHELPEDLSPLPVKVFRLKVNTSTAEQGWNALHRTYTTQLMTHDHAYLHLHTLSRAASQYLADTRKQTKRAREEYAERQQAARRHQLDTGTDQPETSDSDRGDGESPAAPRTSAQTARENGASGSAVKRPRGSRTRNTVTNLVSRGLAKVWPAVSPPTLFSMPTQLFTAQRWPKQKIHVRLTNGRQAQAISELGETQARPSGDEDAAPQAAQQPAQPAMSTPTIVRSRGKRKRKEQS